MINRRSTGALRMSKGDFTLDDFLAQMAQVRKLGPVGAVVRMMPGMGDMLRQVEIGEADIGRALGRMRAMCDSMTPGERRAPESIDAGRRRRIAAGAGVTVAEVCRFIADFEQSRAVMCAVGTTGVMGKVRWTREMRGGDPVLGLVTASKWTRDPSCAWRLGRRRWEGLGWWLALLAAGVFTAWACAWAGR
jgi:signal recognition particle GTPase